MLMLIVPPPPGVNLPTTGESTDYNHYDWIPADRNSKGENDYNEINLQSTRLLLATRARQGSNYDGTWREIDDYYFYSSC